MNFIKLISILFFVEIIVVGSCLGQNSFEIVIENELNETLIDGKTDYDGNYVLTGTSQEVINYNRYVHYSSVIMKVDTLGNYIRKVLQFPDTNCGIYNVIVMPDSNYLFAGHIDPINSDTNQLWLYKTDKQLNKLWEKRFRVELDEGYTQCEFSPYGFINNGNNIIYGAYASYDDSNQDDIVLIKINQNGDLISKRQIHYQFTQSFTEITNIPNTNDFIAFVNHISIFGYQINAIRLDSSFNTISTIPLENSFYFYGHIGSVAHWNTDTSFIYTGFIDEISNPIEDQRIAASIFDTAYQPLKEIDFGKADTIDYPAFYNCTAYINDTTIYVAGFVNIIEFWPDEPNVIEIYKMDSDLNILASNDYSPNAFHSLCGILKSNDGGCLVYGSQHAPYEGNENDIYVLKINPDDLLTSSNKEIIINKSLAKVYPNPTSDLLNIELESKINISEIIIYNELGNKVLVKKCNSLNKIISIDCSNLKPGIYFYSINDETKSVLSGKFVKK